MLLEIINKLLFVTLFASILIILRHSFYFVQALIYWTEEEPVKYKMSEKSLTYLGLAISYVLSVIFTGIKL